jgi:Uma2 family endonuclease
MTSSPDALPRMTPEAYLAYEQDQPVRHELVDGYLYAMTGGSDRHEEIALNLASALRVHLRGGSCRVYKGDLKIRVADDFYYPDVFVRCGADRGDPYFKTDPVLVAEVLSPGTQRYDRGDKRLAFSGCPRCRSTFSSPRIGCRSRCSGAAAMRRTCSRPPPMSCASTPSASRSA